MAKSDVSSWESVTSYVSSYPDQDRSDGVSACDVEVMVGEDDDHDWYIRTQDDAGGSDDAGEDTYPDRDEAVEAAEALAVSETDADEDEDAAAYLRRRTEEACGETDAAGEWCVYWSSACAEDEGPRSRYATREQAEAAADLHSADLHDAQPGQLLCGYEVRQLVQGEWVALDGE